jgi:hypothetical protein
MYFMPSLYYLDVYASDAQKQLPWPPWVVRQKIEQSGDYKSKSYICIGEGYVITPVTATLTIYLPWLPWAT